MTKEMIVLYNAACPVCRREIEHYRRLDRTEMKALNFVDINEADENLLPSAFTEDDLKRRLHVIDSDGRLLSGIPAFAAIWERLPRYRWLSTPARLPVLGRLLSWIYEPIAFGLYRLDKRRQRHRLTSAQHGRSQE